MSKTDQLPNPLIPLSSTRVSLETVGGKALNLAQLVWNGYSVPDGFLIPTSCYWAFVRQYRLDLQIDRALQGIDMASNPDLEAASKRIRRQFSQHAISPELRESLSTAWRWLGASSLAVRSSATAEDLPDLSFAGQQDTFLNVVNLQSLLEAVVNCWSSLWTPRAIGYRARNNIPQDALSLCVVVQKMVPADASGVLFTANPLTGCRTETIIDAVYGLGEALVGGHVEPDHYVVGANQVIRTRSLGEKAFIITANDEGGVISRTTAPSVKQALPDEAIVHLAELGGQIADLFGQPQDIEWAYTLSPNSGEGVKGRLYILQSRPITTLFPLPAGMAPEPLKLMFGFHVIQGITEPLTPLGQDTMKVVLTGAGKLVKLNHTIESQSAFYVAAERLWINITGLLRNPIGHRVIPRILKALDPGVAGTIRELVNDPRFSPDRARPSPRFILRLVGFALPFLRQVLRTLYDPGSRREAVNQVFDQVVAESRSALKTKGDLWVDFSQRLVLLQNAQNLFSDVAIPKGVPLVVAGMAPFFGILERFSRQAAAATGDTGFQTLHLEIARGLPHNITTEMDLELWKIAQIIREDRDSLTAFESTVAEDLSAAYLTGHLPTVAQHAIEVFLGQYGVRGVGEIDIGRPRWNEEPTHILKVLRSYLKITEPSMAPDAVFERGARAAGEAADKLIAAIREHPAGRIKARMVRFAVSRYRAIAGMREAPKFFAIRMMDVIRKGLLESGQAFVEAGFMERSDDLFFLHLRELEAIAAEKRFPQDIRERVQNRRRQRQREMLRRQLPRVLLSDGTTYYQGVVSAGGDGTALVGEPVSPGLADGLVRVVHDPHQTRLEPGEILVCPGTDPAWTPLFLAAAGLVMEVGGMMTHGSVVAREYGIPAIVGVHEATTRLETGQRVRLDGNQGIIEICK